jgi:acetyl esterase
MFGKISAGLASVTLSFSSLALFLLFAVSGNSTASHAIIAPTLQNHQEDQNRSAAKSESQTPADPQVKAVLDELEAAGVAHPTTVEDVRKAYLFYPKLSGVPEKVFRIEDRQIPGPAGSLPIRIYTPNSSNGLPILVFFHGGGFVAGSLDTHDTPLRAVANRCDCIVVSVAYRLAPEHEFPAAPDDAYAATKWLAEHGAEIGGDSRRIAVGGDGSGGNLAAVVTLMARERGTPHLVFQLLIYPMVDATIMRPSWWTESNELTVTREAKNSILGVYLPVTADLKNPFVSPLFAENLRDLPPALVITDQDDPMRDEGEEYARRLRKDGVRTRVSRYPNMIHGFFLMAGDLDAGKKCIAEAGSALENAFSGTPQIATPVSQ